MLKKNLLTILVILLTILLIAMVIWIFNNRIKDVEKKMKTGITYILAINKQKQIS
jgi:cbb3-type cytochrome oxidase subunit 3